jgi:hypothetical protein
MKKLLSLLILLTPTLFSQTKIQPDCNLYTAFNASGNSANFDNRPQSSNTGIPCAYFSLSYSGEPGITSITMEIDGAPDNGGTPGSFALLVSTTEAPNGRIEWNGQVSSTATYYPWIRVKATYGGGASGTVTAVLTGWRSNATTIGGGGGGGSSVPLSSITAAVAPNTIASGNNPQVWGWQQSTASQTALLFDDTSAATGAGDLLVAIATATGSTEVPLTVSNSLSGSQTLSTLQILPSWNTTGTVAGALSVAVTYTAAATGSLLANFAVGGASELSIDQSGNVVNAGGVTATGPGQFAGVTAAGSPPGQLILPGTTNNVTITAQLTQQGGTIQVPAALGGITTTMAVLGIAQTFSAVNTFSAEIIDSAAGAASTPGLLIDGAPFTGGSGSTTVPLVYINDGSAPSTFSTAGTELGFNAPSGFTGNFLDTHVNGAGNVFIVGYKGTVSFAGELTDAAAGAASTPAALFDGAPFTGGSGTTTVPLVYINDGTAPSTFSTAGTEFGINAPSGFTGNMWDFYVAGGSSVSKLDYQGNLTVASCSGCGGGGSTALSGITNATGSNTLSNGNNPQAWGWHQSTASQTAFLVDDTSAATGVGDLLVAIATATGSTEVPLTVSNSLNGSQTLPALSITPTWNTTGVVDAALLVNPTNTASGTGSLLADFQLGGTSQAKIDKAGNITALGFLSTGSSPPSITAGTGGVWAAALGTNPTGCTTGMICVVANSTQNGLMANIAGAGFVPIPTTPTTTTANYVPQYGGTTGASFGTGLPVATTSTANALVETGSGGTIAATFVPTISIAGGGTNATSAAAGTVPNATSGTASSWTATPTLGVASTTTGSVAMENASNAFAFTLASATAMTASNTMTGPVSVPSNGDLLDCTTTSTTCVLTDTAIAAANVVTAASAASAAKQICGSSGVSKTCTYIDFPERYMIPAANCNNTIAGAGWSIGSGGTVTCRAGTNNLGGFVSITDTSSTFAQFQVSIPVDWDSGTRPYVLLAFQSATDTTSGHTVIPEVAVSCPTTTTGTSTDDVTLSAYQSLTTVTFGASAVAHGFYTTSVQFGSTQMSGCIAGGFMIVSVGRATDTATGVIGFEYADVTFPRLLTVQAN